MEMRTLSGAFDYIMRRKMKALGVLLAVCLGVWGIRVLAGEGRQFGGWQGASGTEIQSSCLFTEILEENGAGALTESGTGAMENFAATRDAADRAPVVATSEIEVPKTGGVIVSGTDVASTERMEYPTIGAVVGTREVQITVAEILGSQEDKELKEEPMNIFGLVVSIVTGIMVAAGLLKFISDHYLR